MGLFERLYQATRTSMRPWGGPGWSGPSRDQPVRDAFLLCNDLAMLLLRPHITQVTGIDPLSRDGLMPAGRRRFRHLRQRRLRDRRHAQAAGRRQPTAPRACER